jgi:hypothetical protein
MLLTSATMMRFLLLPTLTMAFSPLTRLGGRPISSQLRMASDEVGFLDDVEVPSSRIRTRVLLLKSANKVMLSAVLTFPGTYLSTFLSTSLFDLPYRDFL